MTARRLAGSALVALLGFVAAISASDEKSLAAAVVGADDLTVFAVALKETGLVDQLQGNGPTTVFAPTDEAFDKLGDDKVRAIVKDKALLKKILLAHIVPGELLFVKNLAALDGKNGFKIAATKDGLTIGGAKLVRPDNTCYKGVLHVIDTVLIPPE